MGCAHNGVRAQFANYQSRHTRTRTHAHARVNKIRGELNRISNKIAELSVCMGEGGGGGGAPDLVFWSEIRLHTCESKAETKNRGSQGV